MTEVCFISEKRKLQSIFKNNQWRFWPNSYETYADEYSPHSMPGSTNIAKMMSSPNISKSSVSLVWSKFNGCCVQWNSEASEITLLCSKQAQRNLCSVLYCS